MSTYLFYPRRLDGSALTFKAHECANDAEAQIWAARVLQEHTSAVSVVVWNGEHMIGSVPPADAVAFEQTKSAQPA